MLWRAQTNLNGEFVFDTDSVFDVNDYSTWPERLHIRVGGQLESPTQYNTLESFAQDKWQVTDRLTVSAGIRYDLDVFPLDNEYNPFFGSGAIGVPGELGGQGIGTPADLGGRMYPVDYNNWAPRTSFAYDVTGDGRSVCAADTASSTTRPWGMPSLSTRGTRHTAARSPRAFRRTPPTPARAWAWRPAQTCAG